jgi:hypothetical protein
VAQVADYSTARFTSGELKAAGFIGVCRYLSLPGLRPAFNEAKTIKQPEYDAHLATGLAVALVMQVDKTDWTAGYQLGFQYGQASLAQSRSLGHPDSAAVPLAYDSAIPASQMHIAVTHGLGYMDGRGLGPQAAYGGTNVINALYDAGAIRWGWQAAAASWSTQPSTHIAIRQLASKTRPQFDPLSYDENDVLQPDWGQNPRPAQHLCLFGYPCPWAA